jgi:hypothetical protein
MVSRCLETIHFPPVSGLFFGPPSPEKKGSSISVVVRYVPRASEVARCAMTRDSAPPPLHAPEAPVRAGAIFGGVWGPVGRRDAAPGSVGMDGAEFFGKGDGDMLRY